MPAGRYLYEPPQGLLLASGIVSPVIYGAAVVIGDAITPGYDQLADPISALLIGAKAAVVEPMFLLYNLLAIMFAWGLHRELSSKHRFFTLGSMAIACSGLLGLVMSFFPMDKLGGPISLVGGLHIGIAALMSFASMACLGLFGVGWRSVTGGHAQSRYAFWSLGVVFVSGGLAAMGTAQAWPMAGLLERITIGTYLVWMFETACILRFRQRVRSA